MKTLILLSLGFLAVAYEAHHMTDQEKEDFSKRVKSPSGGMEFVSLAPPHQLDRRAATDYPPIHPATGAGTQKKDSSKDSQSSEGSSEEKTARPLIVRYRRDLTDSKISEEKSTTPARKRRSISESKEELSTTPKIVRRDVEVESTSPTTVAEEAEITNNCTVDHLDKEDVGTLIVARSRRGTEDKESVENCTSTAAPKQKRSFDTHKTTDEPSTGVFRKRRDTDSKESKSSEEGSTTPTAPRAKKDTSSDGGVHKGLKSVAQSTQLPVTIPRAKRHHRHNKDSTTPAAEV